MEHLSFYMVSNTVGTSKIQEMSHDLFNQQTFEVEHDLDSWRGVPHGF